MGVTIKEFTVQRERIRASGTRERRKLHHGDLEGRAIGFESHAGTSVTQTLRQVAWLLPAPLSNT